MRTAGAAAGQAHQAHAGSWEIFCAIRVSIRSLHFWQRQRARLMASERMGVSAGLTCCRSRRGQVCGSSELAALNCGLHLLFGDVERQVEAELAA